MANPLLRIGMVAARAGVSNDTIRYYERLGLLPKPSRTRAGFREYPAGTVDRIALIRSAARFGFSLRQIADFLRVREAGGKPCHQVRTAAARMLEQVDRQIAELTAARKTMRETLRTWDERLARTPTERPARLLESLAPARSSHLEREGRSAHDGGQRLRGAVTVRPAVPRPARS